MQGTQPVQARLRIQSGSWRSLLFFPQLPLFLHTFIWLMVPNYVSWWALISILESAVVPMVYSNPSPETNAPIPFCADFLASSHNFLEELGKNLRLSSLKSCKSLTIKLVAVVDLRSLFPFPLLARWSLSATQGCSQVVSMWSPPSLKPAMAHRSLFDVCYQLGKTFF